MQKSTPTKFKTFAKRNQLKQTTANPKLQQALAAARRRAPESSPPTEYLKSGHESS